MIKIKQGIKTFVVLCKIIHLWPQWPLFCNSYVVLLNSFSSFTLNYNEQHLQVALRSPTSLLLLCFQYNFFTLIVHTVILLCSVLHTQMSVCCTVTPPEVSSTFFPLQIHIWGVDCDPSQDSVQWVMV